MIKDLSTLFAEYQIYPSESYTENTPTYVFKDLCTNNYYSSDLDEKILVQQNYPKNKIGSDLPWWGKKLFSKKSGCKVMIIAQDSLAKDAGSIVLWAHLFELAKTSPRDQRERLFGTYMEMTGHPRTWKFRNWDRMLEIITHDWNIDLDCLYITDAKKVHKINSTNNKQFDNKKSAELLEREIKICNPNLIIILGKSGVDLLFKGKRTYKEMVGKPNEKYGDIDLVVAPFPIGQGRTQNNFETKYKNATHEIEEILKKCPK